MIQILQSTRGPGLQVLFFLVVSLSLTGIGRYNLHVKPKTTKEKHKEVLSLPPGEVLRQLDLGYHTLMADLLFIRGNLYYGTHIMTDESFPWMENFIDMVLELDPDFKRIYLWGALVTVFYKRQIDFIPKKLVERANHILTKGMQRFPHDYEFPMRIGYNLYYELGEIGKAIPYFERAASLEGAPDWIDETLMSLYKRENQRDLAIKILQEFMMKDEGIINEALRARMLHIMTKEERDQVLSFRRYLEKDWKACCGYLSFDTYLLVKEL